MLALTGSAITVKVAAAGVLAVCGIAVLFGGAGAGIGSLGELPSAQAQAAIPAGYLNLYQAASKTCPGLPWTILAAVGKVESDHGRDATTSSAGAEGPMQFLPSTWIEFGVDVSGDGHADIHNPVDSVFAAARYLCVHGARNGQDLRKALYAYNHSWTYVDKVMRTAAEYGATLPIVAGAITSKVIAYARAQLGKRYVWGAEGPDAYDCSGLAMKAYAAAGISIPRTTFEQWPFGTPVASGQEQPGDLVFFNTGPGAARGRPGHVGIVIGDGKMIEARCARCGPIAVTSYRTRPSLAGFTRPSARQN